MEERPKAIPIAPHRAAIDKLSWADTANDMSAAQETWEEWDGLSSDGLTISVESQHRSTESKESPT